MEMIEMNNYDKKLEQILKAPVGKFRVLEGDDYACRFQPPLPKLIYDLELKDVAIDLARKLNEDSQLSVDFLPKDVLQYIMQYIMDGQSRIIEKTYFVTNSEGCRIY